MIYVFQFMKPNTTTKHSKPIPQTKYIIIYYITRLSTRMLKRAEY